MSSRRTLQWLALILAVAIIAHVPSAPAQGAADDAIPRQIVADSGLRAWAFPAANPARFALVVLVDVGSRDEEKGRTGIAHVVEHCIFRSTREQSTEQLLDGLRLHGVSYNGATDAEMTTYQFDTSVDEWRWLVDQVGRMIATPALREEDIRAELPIVLEELDGRGADLHDTSREQELYPGSALGLSPGGTSRDVGGLGHDDITTFYHRHYVSGAVSVAWAGAVPPAECEAAIVRAFSSLVRGKDTVSRDPPTPRVGAWVPAGMGAGGEAGHLVDGHHVSQRTPETFAAMLVLEDALGDESFRAMRTERSLAYFTSVEFVPHSDAWRIEFTARVKRLDALSDVVAALDVATDRLEKMDASTFEASRSAALGRLTVVDGPSLEQAARLAWPLARAGAADADVAGPLRRLTADRVRSIARGALRPSNHYLLSNDVALSDLPRGVAIVLSILGLAVLGTLIVVLGRSRGRRLVLAARHAVSDLRFRLMGSGERERLDAEVLTYLRDVPKRPPGPEDDTRH